MKAILYIRVSTKHQASEGYSVEEQEQALIRFAMSKGYEVPDEYVIKENGRSGRYGKRRPGFERLMGIVESGGCDAVVVHSLSRFARSQEETVRCTRIMQERGVEFISLSEDLDTRTAMGKAMLGLMAVFAQLYSDQLSERITEAHEHALANGRRVGQLPFGKRRLGNGRVVDDDREMEVVRTARRLRKEGLSYRRIARCLEERGLENKSGVVRWYPSQVQKMLEG